MFEQFETSMWNIDAVEHHVETKAYEHTSPFISVDDMDCLAKIFMSQ